MKRDSFFGENFFAFILLTIVVLLFGLSYARAAMPNHRVPIRAETPPVRRDVRVVKLGRETIASIHVVPGRSTILSFPTKPSKVILGSQGIFAIEYVENDVALSALQPHGVSNVFVYMEGRRYAFDLFIASESNDSIVTVLDDLDEKGRLK